MSWSKVQICNMALAKAGVTQSISALEFAEGVTVPEEARQCALYWSLAFEATARGANWGCLTKPVALLAAPAVTVLPGYAYVYQLPADYLGWPEFDDADTDFRRVGRVLHTDRAVGTLLYVARTEDTDLFDPLFVEALVLRLAAWLARTPVAGSDERKGEALEAWLERVCLPLARFVNSTELGSGSLQQTTWIEARQ